MCVDPFWTSARTRQGSHPAATFLHRLSGDAFLVDRFEYQSTRLGKLGLSTQLSRSNIDGNWFQTLKMRTER